MSDPLVALLEDERVAAAAERAPALLLLPWLVAWARARGTDVLPAGLEGAARIAAGLPAGLTRDRVASCVAAALAEGLAAEVPDVGVRLLVGVTPPRRRKPSDAPERVLARVHAHRQRKRNARNAGNAPAEEGETPRNAPSETPATPVTPATPEATDAEGVTPRAEVRAPEGKGADARGVTPDAIQGVTPADAAERGGSSRESVPKRNPLSKSPRAPATPRNAGNAEDPAPAKPWSQQVIDLVVEHRGGMPTKADLKELKRLLPRYTPERIVAEVADFVQSPSARFGLRWLVANFATWRKDSLTPVSGVVGNVYRNLGGT